MKRLNVAPTRNALITLTRQVRFLEQGHDMLERKRELLTRVIHERLRQYRALRVEVRDAVHAAWRCIAIAQMRMGGQGLIQAALGLTPAVRVTLVQRSQVGVEYPSVSAEVLPLQPVGLMGTDTSFDELRRQLADATALLARLAEAETALYRLMVEQKKTQKRVNALKYNIIPRYRETVRFIRDALEEDARMSLFQVLRLANRPT